MGKLYLDLPFEHIEDLESYGCYYDEDVEKWCYEGEKEDYIKFGKFFMKRDEYGDINTSFILCNSLFLLEGEATCPNCGKKTKVIKFGAIDIIKYGSKTESINGIYQEINKFDFRLIDFNFSELPDYIYHYLLKKYNFEHTPDDEFRDRCQYCNSIVDYYNMSEESPFFLLFNPTRVKNVKVYEIPLKADIIFNGYFDVTLSSGEDNLFYEECNIEKIEL